jgi:hypothetical protein
MLVDWPADYPRPCPWGKRSALPHFIFFNVLTFLRRSATPKAGQPFWMTGLSCWWIERMVGFRYVHGVTFDLGFYAGSFLKGAGLHSGSARS